MSVWASYGVQTFFSENISSHEAEEFSLLIKELGHAIGRENFEHLGFF